MYRSDEPIKNTNEDALSRSNFSKKLAKTLLDMNASSGFCIGLYGEWGSGKTSIINMIDNEIGELTKGKNSSIEFIRFYPWNFSSVNQLLDQFFNILIHKLMGLKDDIAKKAGGFIRKYAKTLNIIKLEGVDRIGDAVSNIGSLIESFSIQSKDIIEQRDKICEELRKLKHKIVIVIDDIDRLSNDQINCIFQLVNCLAKFPNIIYLLSFDEKIVANALTKMHNCDGHEYLEKIIQFPIIVPKANNDTIINIFTEKLNEILNENIKFDNAYWNEIFSTSLFDSITNIRIINRVINSLTFKATLIGEEVNFCDLVALTMVECEYPELYSWIRNNKDILVNTEKAATARIGKSDKDVCEDNRKELERLSKESQKIAEEILKVMFPNFKINEHYSASIADSDLLKDLRIGNLNCYDKYFEYELSKGDISSNEFNYALYSSNVKEFENFIIKKDNDNSSISFLRRLTPESKNIPLDRKKVVIEGLINASHLLKSSENGFINFSAITIAEYDIEKILESIEDIETRFSILSENIKKSNENTIEILGRILNYIEISHGRLSGSNNAHGEKLVSIDNLIILENSYIKKVKHIAENTNLLNDSRKYMTTNYLYRNLAKEEYDKYIKVLFEKDELNKLLILCKSAQEWRTGDSKEWEFVNDYKEYVTDEEVENVMEDCMKDGTIQKLSPNDLKIVLAFELYKQGKTNELGKVSNKEVDNYIKKLLENSDESREVNNS